MDLINLNSKNNKIKQQ